MTIYDNSWRHMAIYIVLYDHIWSYIIICCLVLLKMTMHSCLFHFLTYLSLRFTWKVGTRRPRSIKIIGVDVACAPWPRLSFEIENKFCFKMEQRPIWAHFEQAKTNIIIHDHMWPYMIIYEQVWSPMIRYDHVWSYVYDHTWSHMIIYDHIWS